MGMNICMHVYKDSVLLKKRLIIQKAMSSGWNKG